jgi:hypothetical protein
MAEQVPELVTSQRPPESPTPREVSKGLPPLDVRHPEFLEVRDMLTRERLPEL